MLPPVVNVATPSGVLAGMAARSAASVRPAAGGGLAGAASVIVAIVGAGLAGKQISASAESPPHEIVNRRASVAVEPAAWPLPCWVASSVPWLAEIVIGVPASDMLLAE